jgi:hypothetical protein
MLSCSRKNSESMLRSARILPPYSDDLQLVGSDRARLQISLEALIYDSLEDRGLWA